LPQMMTFTSLSICIVLSMVYFKPTYIIHYFSQKGKCFLKKINF